MDPEACRIHNCLVADGSPQKARPRIARLGRRVIVVPMVCLPLALLASRAQVDDVRTDPSSGASAASDGSAGAAWTGPASGKHPDRVHDGPAADSAAAGVPAERPAPTPKFLAPDGEGGTRSAATAVGARCQWRGEHANSDGAGGHQATVMGLWNIGSSSCALPTVRGVRGLESDGKQIAAVRGSFFPIGAPPANVEPGDRVEFVVTTERLDDCMSSVSRPISSVIVALGDGSSLSIVLDDAINAGCRFSFGEIGSWD